MQKKEIAQNLDGLLRLYQENGNELNNSTWYDGTTRKQRIVYEINTSGNYFIRYSNTNNWGSYPNSVNAKIESPILSKMSSVAERDALMVRRDKNSQMEGEIRETYGVGTSLKSNVALAPNGVEASKWRIQINVKQICSNCTNNKWCLGR